MSQRFFGTVVLMVFVAGLSWFVCTMNNEGYQNKAIAKKITDAEKRGAMNQLSDLDEWIVKTNRWLVESGNPAAQNVNPAVRAIHREIVDRASNLFDELGKGGEKTREWEKRHESR